MKNIKYVSAPCGSGKTHSALNYAIKSTNSGEKYLFVQPTVDSINQSVAHCQQSDPSVRIRQIHGETSSSGVIADINKHLKYTNPEGEIVFITHSAFMQVTDWTMRSDWHVIWDEIPQVDSLFEGQLPESHGILTNLIAESDEPLVDGIYRQIYAKDADAIGRIASNQRGDEVWNLFRDVAGKIASRHWKCYVNAKQFSDITQRHQPHKILIYSLLQPSLFSGFASVTIMGACFEDSVLYHMWSELGFNFVPHPVIQSGLRLNKHTNGNLLAIKYATTAPWSKTFRATSLVDGEGANVLDGIVRRITEELAGKNFVWMGNRDIDDGIFGNAGCRLPNSPHGLNNYQQFHDVAVISALNPKPAHFGFLQSFGLDSGDVRRAGYWQQVYQACCRTSLRNPLDTNPKTVIVMDLDSANWLAEQFPGATVMPLGVVGLPVQRKVGRPRIHANSAARKRACRDKWKHDLVEALGRHQQEHTGMASSLFATVYDKEAFAQVAHDCPDSFIALLRELHARKIVAKKEAGVICPAIFKAPDSGEEASRTAERIESVSGIWLDNDGGDLRHQDFVGMFPDLRIVVFNSHSSTAAHPRWRVFIPTTCAMTLDIYAAVVDQILRVVNRHGYWSAEQVKRTKRAQNGKLHGFDVTKLRGYSLFYLPAQAEGADGSFFHDHHSEQRLPLNPLQWVAYAANHVMPAAIPAPVAHHMGTVVNQADVEAAIAEWRAARLSAGTGNHGFFMLGVALRSAGMSLTDIKAVLQMESAYGRSPDERRKQIPSILQSLKQRHQHDHPASADREWQHLRSAALQPRSSPTFCRLSAADNAAIFLSVNLLIAAISDAPLVDNAGLIGDPIVNLGFNPAN